MPPKRKALSIDADASISGPDQYYLFGKFYHDGDDEIKLLDTCEELKIKRLVYFDEDKYEDEDGDDTEQIISDLSDSENYSDRDFKSEGNFLYENENGQRLGSAGSLTNIEYISTSVSHDNMCVVGRNEKLTETNQESLQNYLLGSIYEINDQSSEQYALFVTNNGIIRSILCIKIMTNVNIEIICSNPKTSPEDMSAQKYGTKLMTLIIEFVKRLNTKLNPFSKYKKIILEAGEGLEGFYKKFDFTAPDGQSSIKKAGAKPLTKMELVLIEPPPKPVSKRGKSVKGGKTRRGIHRRRKNNTTRRYKK